MTVLNKVLFNQIRFCPCFFFSVSFFLTLFLPSLILLFNFTFFFPLSFSYRPYFCTSRVLLRFCASFLSLPPFFAHPLSLLVSLLPFFPPPPSQPPFLYSIRQLKQPSCCRREQTEELLCPTSVPLQRGKLMPTHQ